MGPLRAGTPRRTTLTTEPSELVTQRPWDCKTWRMHFTPITSRTLAQDLGADQHAMNSREDLKVHD